MIGNGHLETGIKMDKIEVQGLVKVYKENCIINGINMEFETGKAYGIVGRNGAGKSVFLKLLMGVLKPTEGIILFGRNDKNVSIGAVIDGCELYMDLTGMENLTYLAGFRKVIGKDKIRSTILQVGLDPDDKRRIRKYSLGMRKRLLIAQAIMEEPDILILDEPANSLDRNGVNMLYEVIDIAKKRGATIFVASHYKEDIERLCDVTYEMKEGKLC